MHMCTGFSQTVTKGIANGQDDLKIEMEGSTGLDPYIYIYLKRSRLKEYRDCLHIVCQKDEPTI